MTGLPAGIGAGLLWWTAGLLAAGSAQLPQQPPPTALPLQLVGVMVDREAPSKSACLIRCTFPGGRRGRYLIGERACDLAEIMEIRQESVTMVNLLTKREEVLALSEGQPAPRPPQPSPSPPAVAVLPDAVAVDLPKGSVDYYLSNLAELLDSAFATPRSRDTANGQRVIDGYQIDRIRPGSVAAQVGLRNGDVILEVNGQALDGVATILRLFGEVEKMTQMKVTVLRDGQKLTFVVRRR